MRTTFVMDPPPIVEDWLAQRRALGQDLHDEVWEGVYHVAAAPSNRHGNVDDQLGWILRPFAQRAGLTGTTACNIGVPDDFRVPDRAYFRVLDDVVWNPTATEIVVKVVSPDDERRAKAETFFFRVGVEELLIVDPLQRTMEWFVRGVDAFQATDGSVLLGITSAELAVAIDWPA